MLINPTLDTIAMYAGYICIAGSLLFVVVMWLYSRAQNKEDKKKGFYMGKNYNHLLKNN